VRHSARRYIKDHAGVGERYGLGTYQRHDAPSEAEDAWGLFIGKFLSITAFYPFVAWPFFISGGHDWQLLRTLGEVQGGMFLAGMALRRAFRHTRKPSYLWYSEGFLVLDNRLDRPQVMHDAEMTALTVKVRRWTSEGEEKAQVVMARVRDRAGNLITAGDPEAGPYQIAPLAARSLAHRCASVLAPTVTAAMIACYKSGEPVRFGEGTEGTWIGPAGITFPPGPDDAGDDEPYPLAWAGITRVTITARTSIAALDLDGQWHQVDLGEAENAFLAYHLIEHAVAGTGIPVDYRAEDGLPARVRVPRG
jgi:hypothetical protein